MDRLGEVPESHLLAEHRPEPARVRQRADQHDAGSPTASVSSSQSHWISSPAGCSISTVGAPPRRCWQTRHTGRSPNRRNSRTSVG